MSRVMVVSIGPGNVDYISQKAKERLEQSDFVLGSRRQIEDVRSICSVTTEFYVYKKITEIKEVVEKEQKKKISILVSGDSGYYSLVPYLKKVLREEFDIIPGLSSFQYLFSKIGENWQDFFIGSVHGRKLDYIQKFREENRGLVLLTDEENNPKQIAKNLWEAGFRKVDIIVGENLSYQEENISYYKIEDWEIMPERFEMNVCIYRKGEENAYL
ncbi:precorrin-6y C5,15-methyltransferase (decarboxylating) subunit CbiE [Fusobacterium gonidiaformans]|uniref:precorrin-6y C5,15-methyltransferase (decarboxylating) subunit CbiE n=1 Tax=Fusobacterium gonidiaformans TaxID=849 RepID=UPI0023F26740|nr:precorrin-6y C5,15-methyltransferase (decarboxylating) subunit CbiE [Fusobacterium gonidiaformans]